MSNEIKTEDIRQKSKVEFDVAEHEILLAFNSDWQAEAFDDWFNTEGRKAFLLWAESHSVDYED